MSARNRSRFSGSWYPQEPVALSEQLDRLVNNVDSDDRFTQLSGAVLPHAGLTYSGRGIAHAFAHTPTDLARVLVLSPSHYQPLVAHTLVTESFDSHETPLGDVPGDIEFSYTLRSTLPDATRIDNGVIEKEHGTEMFLPFIRHFLPQARVSMILVPATAAIDDLSRWAATIRNVLDEERRRTLVVMSSDFTHYGPRFGYTPFGVSAITDTSIAERVADDDLAVAKDIARGDIPAFRERMERPITVCGRFPILLGTMILGADPYRSGALRGSVVDYYSSRTVGEGAGANFVCYASILFQREVGDERS